MARDLADPPDLAPEILWRSLLPFRPQRPLPTRLRGAPHIPLFVRAVPALQEALARDAAHCVAGAAERPGGARGARLAREILALVLHTPEGRAFPSAEALGVLEAPELDVLARDALQVLADIAPTCARSHTGHWLDMLREGAKHPENRAEASTLAACVDLTPVGPVPRPDRYWGGPFHQLLDGHWLAYQAARDAFAKT